MKKKGICILVTTLLITTALPAFGDMNIFIEQQETNSIFTSIIKETYMVPMRDGVKLATDVYLPYEGYPPHGSILIRTRYNKNTIETFLIGQGYDLEKWVENGWPFVVQDERGFYASEGDPSITNNGYYDGYDTVEWVAQQNWSNDKIATWGRSAFGMNQYWMAGTTPPHLSCQFIGVATSNFYNFVYPGGQFRKAFVEYYFPPSTEDFELILTNENFSSSFWSRYILEDKWNNVQVPAIHIGGWYDGFVQGTINGYMGYQHEGGTGANGNSKLIMGPWTHHQFGYNETNTGDLTFPDNQYDTFSRDLFLEMISQYTMDESNDFDKWPTVTYYVMCDVDDINAPGNEWRYADDWPILAEETPFYFHEDEVLSQETPGSFNPVTFSYDPTDPVPNMGGQNIVLFGGPKDQRPIESRADVLIFTSDVFTEPFESTGPVKARLFVSSNCSDTDFTVKLTDVYPDGRSMLITDGILRMRNRNGNNHWDFMNPGEIYEVEVDLNSTSYIWNTGHKIRVAVSSSNYPRFLANPNTVQSILEFYQNPIFNTAQNIVYIDSDHPSCIILQDPNVAPDKPTINGPLKGKKNVEYEFTFNSNDPESDDVYYFVDWGDNSSEDWVGPYSSGENFVVKHKWNEKSTFTISARAKDANGLWSDMEVTEIVVPRISVRNWLFQRFLENFFNSFPILNNMIKLFKIWMD